MRIPAYETFISIFITIRFHSLKWNRNIRRIREERGEMKVHQIFLKNIPRIQFIKKTFDKK